MTSQQRLLLGISDQALLPPLKWAGGKRWLIPTLKALYNAHRCRRLVEPFAGGLAVSLGLTPERALIADINPHLINFYQWLQTGLQCDIDMVNDAGHFYTRRSRFNAMVNTQQAGTKEAAALFYYLNRTCFNGLCRFNAKGLFNVPFGRYKQIHYVQDFSDYAAVLGRWDIRHGSFEQVRTEPEDFIYADPPYDTPFTQYAKEGFNWPDQERLAAWLSRHPGPVVASNQATERIIALYTALGFDVQTIMAPRRIACNGNRMPAVEMLAKKGL